MSCEIESNIIHFTRPYLLPVLVELSLLAAPMVYDFLDRTNAAYCNSKTNPENVSYPKLHKSKRGLMIGAVVILVSIGLIVALYLLESFGPMAALAVYYCQGILYSVLALLVATLTYFKIRPLRLHPAEGTAVDRHILWLSFFGSLVFEFLHITASAYMLSIHASRHEDVLLRGIDLTNAILSLLDMCLQSLVILNTMHRVARHYTDVERKPGRGHIVLLLCINLSLWIIHTFEVKKAVALEIATEKSITPYLSVTYVLQHVAMPLVVLFRFHSTVCLSLVWNGAFDEDHIIEGNFPI